MLSFLLLFFEILHWGIWCVFVICGLGSCLPFFESNMAVCLKQVDAAQKFLRAAMLQMEDGDETALSETVLSTMSAD